MTYAELFDKILKEKGLSDRKAAQETGKAGHAITASYINQIRNGKKEPPVDEVSKVIATICGKPEELLVFQKYYDIAPEAFRNMIEKIRGILICVLIVITESGSNVERIKTIENEFEKLSITELITKSSNVNLEAIRQSIGAMSQADMLNAANQDGYPVEDDAMSPTIPKGATVYTFAHDDWTQYKDEDIFCYHKIGDTSVDSEAAPFYVREIQFLNDEHTRFRTLPINRSYPKETLTKKDVFLYGKVTGMFVDFE